MKEIGEDLKEARENMSLSIEEVASDLKLRPIQVENIENGNIDSFKDIFYLKSLIKEYSKYLGLNHDNMVDEFNEYLFDHTSRISLDEIKKAKKKIEKKETRIASPYTLDKKKNIDNKLIIYIVLIISILFGIIIGYNIIKNDNNESVDTDIIK